MSWAGEARRVIYEAVKDIPEETPLKERKAVVDAAYPFGERKYFPYKMWLKERKAYLVKYGHKPQSKALVETPMERMIRRSKL